MTGLSAPGPAPATRKEPSILRRSSQALSPKAAKAAILARLAALEHPPDLLDAGAVDELIKRSGGSRQKLQAALASTLFLASTEDAAQIGRTHVQQALQSDWYDSGPSAEPMPPEPEPAPAPSGRPRHHASRRYLGWLAAESWWASRAHCWPSTPVGCRGDTPGSLRPRRL